jgi:hypothetical protein
VNLEKEAVQDLYHGHKVAGATAVQLCPLSFPLLKGVLLRTPGARDPVPNTHCVWVGPINVTADSDTDTGGMPLPPGESMFFPVDSLMKLWLVSTAEGQDVSWMAM